MKQLAILFTLLGIFGCSSSEQDERIKRTLELYKTGELDGAKTEIDSYLDATKDKAVAMAWYYRGFIYKEIYNKKEEAMKESASRIEALGSFRTYLENAADTSKKEIESARKSIIYLATTLYNDAATSLDTVNYEAALRNFDRYREWAKYLYPDTSIALMATQFKLVLAQVYTKIYESDRLGKEEFFGKTGELYEEILQLDPENLNANYNLGILYYNEGVHLIKLLDRCSADGIALNTDLTDPDTQIPDIQALMSCFLELTPDVLEVQDITRLFKTALPFFEAAYRINPTRRETLIGLSGIYFSLNQMDKSERMNKELEELATEFTDPFDS